MEAMAATNSLSARVQRMAESATLKMSRLARELRAEGHDVISLSIGQPDFDTPQHIREAAKKALDEGYTRYTPVSGLLELRQAISAKFKRENDLDYDVNQIVVSNGAKQSIANLALALLNEGDEVIIFSPYWVSYHEIIKLGDGTPVPISAGIEQDYKVTPAQLAAAITDKTKMVLFSSPCNPTGSVYSHEELAALAAILAPHKNIIVVSDEIYEHITFAGKHVSIGTFEAVKDRTVTVNGFSKGFAMTGWRLGYIGAPLWIAKACAKIQGQTTSGATAFGQKAAAYALNASMEATYNMTKAFLKRRDLVIDLLRQIPGFKVNNPDGAFYIFPDASAYIGMAHGDTVINDMTDFSEYLLLNAHVAVVTGDAFGAPGCFRISYAASEETLKTAIARIATAVAQLK